MSELVEAIERLNELEPGLRSLDTLFALGVIETKSEGGHQAGDWDLHIWAHNLKGFSVGAIERVRNAGEPFPMLVHAQKKWIICSKGTIKIVCEKKEAILREGQRVTVKPMTSHKIYAVSEACTVVFVTVPADPGMSDHA